MKTKIILGSLVVVIGVLSIYVYNITNEYDVLMEQQNQTLEEYGFAMEMLDGFMSNPGEMKRQVQQINQNPLGTI